MTVESVAEGIRMREKEEGKVVHHGVADPAIFIADGGLTISGKLGQTKSVNVFTGM